ncbi:MAG: tyrosine--tRNA ligase, partial [Clostridia bacterium]|nr:tyrosine--tRNA ligase [Clostridia bacterium]
ADADNMPATAVAKADLDAGLQLLDVMVAAGLCKSKGEGRRLIQQGGVSLNDEKVADPMLVLTDAAFEKGYAVVRKGKKVFHKIIVE